MANCELTLRLFLVFVCLLLSLSSCSFKNNSLRTNLEEDNLVANLTGSLYFCSQASSLVSPVMKLPMPPLPTNPSLHLNDDHESVATKCISQPLLTISNLPTVCIGSRSSNLYSPIIDVNTRLSPLEHSLSLLFLTLLLLAAVAPLVAWMFLSLPFLSYIMASSLCETLTLSPSILLNSLKTKVREVYHFGELFS